MANEAQSTASDNVVALRGNDELEQDGERGEVAEPEHEGMPTAAKVGVGVAATGAAGLTAWGIYEFGKRRGWWGGPRIVIDDPADSDDGSKKDGAAPSGGGGTWTNKRAVGRPPNVTGDPAGYDTTSFPNPAAVRLVLKGMGYDVEYSQDPLATNDDPHPEVRKFQKQWNQVIRGLDSGRVKFKPNPPNPAWLKHFRGLLVEDGIPGKNTLNGMHIAFGNVARNLTLWSTLTKQA